jgi:hypothetical protein
MTEDDEADQLLSSVRRNPHELRFVTYFKKRYGRYSLEGIQRASHTLLPAIRDVLPAEGSKVREVYSQAQELFQQKPPSETPQTIVESEVKKKGFRNRLRSFFSRSQKKKNNSLVIQSYHSHS